MQVVAGELELNHECNSMNWSPEDFESKLQVTLMYSMLVNSWLFQTYFNFSWFNWFMISDIQLACYFQEAMKQTYQRALKAATDFGYQKESPE